MRFGHLAYAKGCHPAIGPLHAPCRTRHTTAWSTGDQLFDFLNCTIMMVGPEQSYIRRCEFPEGFAYITETGLKLAQVIGVGVSKTAMIFAGSALRPSFEIR